MANDARALWPVEAQEHLVEMEELHRRAPHDRAIMLRLARFLLGQGEITEAQKYLRRAGTGISQDRDGLQMLLQVGATYLQAWREMKSVTIDGVLEEVYMGEDRKALLASANKLFSQALIIDEVKKEPASLLQIAVGKEHEGSWGDTLTILSEVISNHQDCDGLSLCLFKAGTLLHHGQEWAKARQYLEFLSDVNLPASGLAYSIYYAELITMYEGLSADNKTMGKKVQAQLKEAYAKLQRWFTDERRAQNPDKYDTFKLMRIEDFKRSPLVWVELAMEALHTCSYLLASHFLLQAVQRNSQLNLLLLLAESLWMTKQVDRAVATLEQAYAIDNDHDRVRQLLRRWAPSKWEDKLKGKGEVVVEELDGDQKYFLEAARYRRRPSSATTSSSSHGSSRPTSSRPVSGNTDKAGSRPSSGKPEPASPGGVPPKPRRVYKSVAPDKTLFKDVTEVEVRKTVRRAIEGKLDLTEHHEVLQTLSNFPKVKTRLEVANTRVRLQKKFG